MRSASRWKTLTAEVVTKGGGEVKGAARYPFPDTTDFSSYLAQAQASGATVVGFANAGLDTENCIKQAAEFGLNKTMKIAPLLMFIQNPHSLGTQICGGLLTTETFYWDLNDRTRRFTKSLLARTKAEQLPEPGPCQFLRLNVALPEGGCGDGRSGSEKERTRGGREDEGTSDRR